MKMRWMLSCALLALPVPSSAAVSARLEITGVDGELAGQTLGGEFAVTSSKLFTEPGAAMGLYNCVAPLGYRCKGIRFAPDGRLAFGWRNLETYEVRWAEFQFVLDSAGWQGESVPSSAGWTDYPAWYIRSNDRFTGTIRPTSRSVLPAVPEPSTWMMMIGGIGFAGAALRGRRGRLRFEN